MAIKDIYSINSSRKEDYNTPSITTETQNIKAYGFDKLDHYHKNGYFLFKNSKNTPCLAINNTKILKERFITALGDIDSYFVNEKDFYQILQRDFSAGLLSNSVNYLTSNTEYISARDINYIKAIAIFLLVFFGLLICSFNFFSLINYIIYAMQNVFKISIFNYGLFGKDIPYKSIDTDNTNLPVYSILIPLYKEELKAKAIISAIQALNYPKNKLDVKFILESDDQMTIRALAGLEIPNYIQLIKVPYSLPRTKPKALNYAIQFARGEYLTIYDAEDEPDPEQLLKAISAFRELPEEYVCVQSRLNFYNAKENLLTRFFSIEYSIWFEYLLKGLSLLNLPVTLGGTSNHFKFKELKEVGFWDAYNVTEDADLGIRLYLKGYKVHMIDSVTMEEAPNNLKDWIAQRSRWIKGFIQTICVFAKTKKDYTRFGLIKVFVVYLFVGISTYNFFFLPWLILILLSDLSNLMSYIWFSSSCFVILYMYFSAHIAVFAKKTPKTLKLPWGLVILALWPAYFILHTIASYRSLWEIIVAPFVWNKTPHGTNIDDL
jgi:cellulose synthase/poly-beta-1,6-N-acetylglucosamine synthase-like glycosyltransferase